MPRSLSIYCSATLAAPPSPITPHPPPPLLLPPPPPPNSLTLTTNRLWRADNVVSKSFPQTLSCSRSGEGKKKIHWERERGRISPRPVAGPTFPSSLLDSPKVFFPSWRKKDGKIKFSRLQSECHQNVKTRQRMRPIISCGNFAQSHDEIEEQTMYKASSFNYIYMSSQMLQL